MRHRQWCVMKLIHTDTLKPRHCWITAVALWMCLEVPASSLLATRLHAAGMPPPDPAVGRHGASATDSFRAAANHS